MGHADRAALAHACAGALAGSAALAALFPLDTVRMHLQATAAGRRTTAPQIVARLLRDEGVRGLYSGLRSSVASLLLANFVYFGLYQAIKGRRPLAGRRAALVPALAGALNVLIVCPAYVITARLRTARRGEYANAIECARRVCAHEGVRALWSGLAPSLWLVSNPTVQFYCYEQLKAFLVARAGGAANVRPPPPPRTLSDGTNLTSLASPRRCDRSSTSSPRPRRRRRRPSPRTHCRSTRGASHPLQPQRGTACPPARTTFHVRQVAQTLLRLGEGARDRDLDADSSQMHRRFGGMISCLRYVARERGTSGLYAGLGSKLWQTVLTAAVQLMIYEQLAAALTRRIAPSRPVSPSK